MGKGKKEVGSDARYVKELRRVPSRFVKELTGLTPVSLTRLNPAGVAGSQS